MKLNKSSYLILIFVLFINVEACSQTKERQEEVSPYSWQDLEKFKTVSPHSQYEEYVSGYRHKQTKEVIIPPTYRRAYEFHEGFAQVKLENGRYYGFINAQNEVVVPFKYKDADNFSEGLAAVYQHKKWGFVDTTGQEVIPLIYQCVYNFSEGRTQVCNENYKRSFIDRTGKLITPFQYDWVGEFQEGLAPVEKNKKWGYVNTTGQEVIPLIYDFGAHFIDSIALAIKDSVHYLINPENQIIVNLKEYDYVEDARFPLGLFRVARNGKEGLINSEEKLVIPLIYELADTDFGLAQAPLILVKQVGKLGVIDTTGKIIIPLLYEGVFFNPSTQHIEATKNNQVEFYDTQGNRID